MQGLLSVSLLEWKPAKTSSCSHIAISLYGDHSSHHHEASTLGLVYHRFLPGAEVHCLLFTWLDFDLNAGNNYRHILTF